VTNRVRDWLRPTPARPSLLELGTAAIFMVAGVLKLVGIAPMVALYAQLGLGQWLRYLTAGMEIGGALLIASPRTALLGAAVLTAVMGGAIGSKIVLLHETPWAAVALLVVLGAIIIERRSEIFAVLRAIGRVTRSKESARRA
jgi:uncharacterized membrane protein YphA (DoxX/SURF4 family)